MKRRALAFAFWTVLATALAGPASAEQAKPSQGKAPAVAASAATTPGVPLRGRTGTGEPPELAGIMVKQNEARAKLGLPLLTWSPELADRTREAIGRVTAKTCTLTAARRAEGADEMNLFWAGGMRSMTGTTRMQDITAPYVVSEWAAGKASWNAATQSCRRTTAGASSCQDYARITRPAARSIGCVRTLCPSQGQIWACSYAPAAKP